jgi:ABC-2 type transport system permease protein
MKLRVRAGVRKGIILPYHGLIYIRHSLPRIYNIARYEWRRALARRMILAVFILTCIIEVLPIIVLTLLPNVLQKFGNLRNYVWLLGALIPQGFFIHFLALLVSAGSMADEYQNATADVILSKPLSRVEYLVGKYLGGFSLMSAIAALLVSIGILASFAAFGNQLQIVNAPLILLGIIASSLVFFSIGFMSGELLRSTTLSYLAASSAFIVILIIENVLEAVAPFQPNPDFYYLLGRLLPTWAATNLPFMQADQLFPAILNTRLGEAIFQTVPGTIPEALLYIAIYASAAFAVALLRFRYTDVTKRGS